MKQKSSKRLILFGCQIVMLLAVIPAAGQIRLHDPASDELAKKTRDAFAEFSKGDANVFETMLSNTMSLKEATLAQLYDLNRQGTRDAVNLVPVQTWKQLRGRVKKTQDDFLLAYNAARTILDEKAAQAPDLKAALKLAQDELTALNTKRTQKAAELDAEQPDLKKLKDSLDKLKDALVLSTKPVNRLSDLEIEFNNLKSVWAGIASVKEFWEAAQKSTNAPGLQLTILDVAVTHQQAKVDRLKLDLEEADAAQKRGARIAQRLQVVWFQGEVEAGGPTKGEAKAGLFGQVYKGIGSVADQDERVLVTIGKLAKEAEDEVGTKLDATMKLRNLLDILGRYTTLAGYQKYLLLSDAIEAGVDTHLFSIRRSAINTRDREMLVSYGLDGLAAYHAGGLRPEQVANFFRAAQSIALGVLAWREE
jgi:hypothetical protein